MGAERAVVAGGEPPPTTVRRVLVGIDKLVEGTAIGFLVAMIVVVFVQVMTRKLFRFVFFWSEEVTLLLLTWFSFMGIAIGFREKLHLAMDMVSGLLGRRVRDQVRDPGLVQRRQLRMAGRSEHDGGRAQGLPGGRAQQPGRHPRAGREDDQQAGVSPDGTAVGAGPADRVTVGSEGTTRYWV